ncbi:MAG TPA: DNA methyltransferase [Acidobacteriaceae bacterium]
MGRLFYGDNIDILRRKIDTASVDVCYIDPPFNSQRNYNQIYNNVGEEDRAQAQAFLDTWVWDERAGIGFSEIVQNAMGRFQPQLVELIKGLRSVLHEGSLLAYLVSLSLRMTEIHRTLKESGTFFLHCDPTSSHYLKLILDAIFCGSNQGDFRNEIIWSYETGGRSKKDFGRKHDVILRYTKSSNWIFNADAVLLDRAATRKNHMKRGVDPDGRIFHSIRSAGKIYKYYADQGVIPSDVWSDISHLQQKDPERMGYPTQKPEALLERILLSACPPGGVVLDAYCGCGTTVVVAEKLGMSWTGIDITYQSISLILKRLEERFKDNPPVVKLDGVPKDLESAKALATKSDDRLRKEFEKWAVLTYTSNRAIINEKKGADAGVDAIAYFQTSRLESAKIIFQVKSGKVKRADIATLRGDMQRENAPLAVLITLSEPTSVMISEAKAAGQYTHDSMGRNYDRISIVTVQDIVSNKRRLDIPMSLDVLKKAQTEVKETQMDLLD